MNPLGDAETGKTGGTEGSVLAFLFCMSFCGLAIWFGDDNPHGRMAWQIADVMITPSLVLLGGTYGWKRWIGAQTGPKPSP